MDIYQQAKTCSKCKIQKPFAEFGKDKQRRSGIRPSCRECENARVRTWYNKPENRKKIRVKTRRYWLKNKAKFLTAQRKWVAANRTKYQGYCRTHLLKKYGLAHEEYAAMVNRCGNLCEICRQPERMLGSGGAIKRLAIDHCAKTGVVRGLLCHACNTSLGQFSHNPQLLRQAAEYLELKATVMGLPQR